MRIELCDYRDLPEDQWNIKFLLRQGPKDLRMFLSLFTQNAFGKALLPEIYYLGGIPLTEEVGRDTRRMIGTLSISGYRPMITPAACTPHCRLRPSSPRAVSATLRSPKAMLTQSKLAAANGSASASPSL